METVARLSRGRKSGKRQSSVPARGVARPAQKVLSGFSTLARGWTAWWQTKNPVLRFVGVFALVMALYYAVTLSGFFETFFRGYLRWMAVISSTVLGWMGQRVVALDTSLTGPQLSISIRRGCDAIDPSMLFAAALLAFPAPWPRKIAGLCAGVVLLQMLNLVRIVSLYLVGVHFPGAFHAMHADVWQMLFILVAVVCWALWIIWAKGGRPPATHVSA